MIMERKKIRLGFSSCPNDTYIFCGIATGAVDTSLDFEIVMDDVEALNKLVSQKKLHVSKVSVATLGIVNYGYRLLKTGGAMGMGCGPMIVSRPGFRHEDLFSCRIAIPGEMTTAHLLLSLYFGTRPKVDVTRFDKIMPLINAGICDAGVVIHEGRFTYQDYGLECIMDLGQWWEETTGLPVPLGGIVVDETFDKETCSEIVKTIRQSILYGRENQDKVLEFVRQYAQEMDEDVMMKHIELYVNDYTYDMGEKGVESILTLLSMAKGLRFFNSIRVSVFED